MKSKRKYKLAVILSFIGGLSNLNLVQAAPHLFTYLKYFQQLNFAEDGSLSIRKIDSSNIYEQNRDEIKQSQGDDYRINSKISLGNLELSGFADFNYFEGTENKGLSYGQFEINITANIVENLTFEGALALDEGSFVPGAGYLDYHFSGSEEGHNARGNFNSNSGIHVGQFDVPFGRYYEQIPSTARFISMIPIAIEKSINCMNTYGVNFYYNSNLLQFNTFALNGLNEGYILGGRAGLTFSQKSNFGFSFLSDFKNSQTLNAKIFGIDFSSGYSIYTVRSEVIWSNNIYEGEFSSNKKSTGYYIENEFDISELSPLSTLFLFRFGAWSGDEEYEITNHEISQYDFSLNIQFNEQCQIKLEYRLAKQANTEQIPIYGIQLVFNY